MKAWLTRWAAAALFCTIVFGLVSAQPAFAQNPKPVVVSFAYLALVKKQYYPASFLDPPPPDDGIQGARLGLADNRTTGHFLGQAYHMAVALEPTAGAVLAAFHKLAAAGQHIFVTDLPAALLLKVSDLPEARNMTFLDATSRSNMLRAQGCRTNTFHLLPSNAMLADGLMQYLVVKRWTRIMLLSGKERKDIAYANAIRASAHKFHVRIVADKTWTFDPTTQRADTGHFQIDTEVSRITQGVPSYDVLVVADIARNFGDSVEYATRQPRPVAGTAGLQPAAWGRAFQEYGGTQLQFRFMRQAKRWMTQNDYGAWMAVRAIGEAATRTGSGSSKVISNYLHGSKFSLAAFKGVTLTFRPWDEQLRQPVLLLDSRSLVSISPQPGFLHPVSELDTLGVDKPETKCHMH
ncbi:MAG TPA: ABC transporter substrate-binding protein [Acetobacteraceae bacterium]|nr:ABC transporter substrate-binding protein [Acetobacteraceae bacterium]